MVKQSARTKSASKSKPTATAIPIAKKRAHVQVSQVKTATLLASRAATLSVKKKTSPTLARSAKRYAKQTVRDILLSKLFHTAFKLTMGIVVFGSALYGAYALLGDTISNDVVVSKSEIVARVAKLTGIPQTEPDAVVRVQDADTLKKQNVFYADVKEGDYIVMYPTLAVIYDLRNNSIVAMKRSEK